MAPRLTDPWKIYTSKKLTKQEKLFKLETLDAGLFDLVRMEIDTDAIGETLLQMVRDIEDPEERVNTVWALRERDPKYTGVLLTQL